ncbi:MAG: TerB family tellurite resistance protein [Cyclobacteriaceae bacterium]
MIGFFENQYLSYKKDHIKNLLALAKADGHVHEKEEAVIYKIGKRYGLKERQVKAIMDSDEKFKVNVPNNHHDKMNVLYDLMLIVFADGVVEKKEVAFCEDVAKQFQYKKEIVKWLLTEVFEKGKAPAPDDWDEMREYALANCLVKK